ncbi:O-antigen ligase family protein [candidate division WWE3 bacterium]|nr:O-antigen ligase family protein [candidate division WWE3 bacterium]
MLRLFLVVYIWFEVKLEKELKNFILIFSFQVVFLVILGLMQWQKQSSVFDNYLFFGEQVYDSTTFNVARTTINGEQRIPAYATFRHPNIFGGYLSIFFIWALYFLTTQPYLTTNLVENNTVKKNWQHKFPINIKMGFIYLVLIMAFVGTITTFSQFAILAVLLGSIFYFVIKYFGKSGVFASLLVTFFVFISSFLLTHLTYLGDFGKSFLLNPSIYRRVNLEISAYQMIVQNPVWGVGLNNFTVNLSNYLPLSQVLTFNQPVHNTFLLIFAESGVFVLLAFFAILFLCFRSLLAQGFGFPVVLFINLLQIIILGSFDHYFYTIPQTQILFLLTVGLSLTYTYTNAKV